MKYLEWNKQERHISVEEKYETTNKNETSNNETTHNKEIASWLKNMTLTVFTALMKF